jgi:hypothetical protein
MQVILRNKRAVRFGDINTYRASVRLVEERGDSRRLATAYGANTTSRRNEKDPPLHHILRLFPAPLFLLTQCPNACRTNHKAIAHRSRSTLLRKYYPLEQIAAEALLP